MGAFLLAAGEKGRRFVLPNSRVMIHQIAGGAQGQGTDVEIQVKEMLRLKRTLTELLAKHCEKPYEKVLADAERDNYMTAAEAVAYGIADKVIESVAKSND
jgi:ATP-dependent Clp protease protease subunit